MASTHSESGEVQVTVCISHLEPNIEPAYILRMVGRRFGMDNIEEIETSGDSAYITFKDRASAEATAMRYHDQHSDVKHHRLRAYIVSDYKLNERGNLLSQFLRDEEAYKGVETATVRVDQLPYGHTRRSLGLLLDEFCDAYGAGEFLYPKEIAVPNSEWGVAYIQFEDKSDAVRFAQEYNGSYWKNAVIYAHCVPDGEIEEHLVKKSDEKDVGFWVGNLNAGITAEDITKMFYPFSLQNVNIPKEGSTFAFVFMTNKDAAGFNALHPQGFKYHGRWIKVRLMKNKGNAITLPSPQGTDTTDRVKPLEKATNSTKKNARLPLKDAPLPPGPTDVRVDNVPYAAQKSELQDLFKGFEVTKVVLKKGYGFVGLASLKDAQSASSRLGGRKVLGRTVSVKVAGPPPTHG